jgi:hypothetical protein
VPEPERLRGPRAGRVTIELANFGEDTHNFKLKRVGKEAASAV